MSNIKTRYLQLSDVIMLEYNFLGQNDTCTKTAPAGFLFTKLADGHYAAFSENVCEVTSASADSSVNRKSFTEIQSFNDINHLAVPKDKADSFWYTFLDPDYDYCTLQNQSMLYMTDPKVVQYAQYCQNPDSSLLSNPFVYHDISQTMRWDSMRLYFVNGYDFSNIYGVLSRISLMRNDNSFVDLCNFFFNKTTALSMIQYLDNPIIFGNSIYDRYIEVNMLCLYDILNTTAAEKVNDILDIKSTSNIRLSFSYVNDNDYKVTEITYNINDLIGSNIINKSVNCEFVRGSSLNGTIPTENINSDNLGLYIGENPDSPYIEFYGTWKNQPLSFGIVQTFNRTVKLYDTSLIRKENGVYEVESDYKPEVNFKKWVAMHELECTFMQDASVLKTETYNMSQVFVTDQDDEITKFYYRPVIFDEALANLVTAIAINYSMRFINVEDKVQFLKRGTLSITNVNKFYAKGSKLKVNDVIPYKVYNKIIESKQNVTNGVTISPKTKYVKVFYNSTDVILEDTNGAYYGTGTYAMTLSPVAKTYKFVVKKYISGTKYEYFDLSDGYYKLYTKDASGNPIVIDPTYSQNMNTVLGEIEFNLSTAVVNKLMNVPDASRKMSIVAYNDDNSVSSLYDFTYTF